MISEQARNAKPVDDTVEVDDALANDPSSVLSGANSKHEGALQDLVRKIPTLSVHDHDKTKTSILSLPLELHRQIIESLDTADFGNYRAVTSGLRDFLSHDFFERITLHVSSADDDLDRLESLSNSEHAPYVRRLIFANQYILQETVHKIEVQDDAGMSSEQYERKTIQMTCEEAQELHEQLKPSYDSMNRVEAILQRFKNLVSLGSRRKLYQAHFFSPIDGETRFMRLQPFSVTNTAPELKWSCDCKPRWSDRIASMIAPPDRRKAYCVECTEGSCYTRIPSLTFASTLSWLGDEPTLVCSNLKHLALEMEDWRHANDVDFADLARFILGQPALETVKIDAAPFPWRRPGGSFADFFSMLAAGIDAQSLTKLKSFHFDLYDKPDDIPLTEWNGNYVREEELIKFLRSVPSLERLHLRPFLFWRLGIYTPKPFLQTIINMPSLQSVELLFCNERFHADDRQGIRAEMERAIADVDRQEEWVDHTTEYIFYDKGKP